MTIYNNASEVWLAISLANSQSEILSALKDANASNVKLDSNDLKNLALSQSVDAGGAKVAALYAGNIPQFNADGSPTIDPVTGQQKVIYSGEYAKTTAATSGGTIAIIDNTEASKFVGDDHFKRAIEMSFDDVGSDVNQFFNGTTDANGTRTSHGLFGDLSVKFVTENNFEQAITFSNQAGSDSILFSKEIPTLLGKEGFKSVDGLEKSYLNSLKEATGNFDDVVSDIKSSSGAHYGLLEIGEVIDETSGEKTLVLGTKKFLENLEGVQSTDLPSNASNIKSGATLLGKDLSWIGDHLPSKAVLSKLGVAGDILSLGFATKSANEAIESGNNDLAKDIMGKWAADFLGGSAGAAGAIAIVAPLIAVLAPGAIVAGTIAIASGVAGGILGGEAGQYLYEKAQELGAFVQNDLQDDLADFKDALTNYWNDLNNEINDIADSAKLAFQSFSNAVLSAVPPKHDPLIIDVNNNGLKLSSWQSSGVKFDMDNNGTTESTGWTTPSSSNYSYVKGSGAIIIDQANANLIDRIVFKKVWQKKEMFFQILCFAIFLLTIPTISYSQNQSATVIHNNKKGSFKDLDENGYNELDGSRVPRIFSDKSGNKYELRFFYSLIHGVVKFNYKLAPIDYIDKSECDKLSTQEPNPNKCDAKYRKVKVIDVFDGIGSGEYAVSGDMKDLLGCNDRSERSMYSQKYIVKDLNGDGYKDIGFKFEEINCITKKITTYEKNLVAVKRGFELQENNINN